MSIVSIIIAIILFSIIVLFHELGHFLLAKANGIRVNEFSLGLGPTIVGFTKGETKYSIRLFPIGGFVSMEGEDEDSENERAFCNKPVWQRFIIVAAGGIISLIKSLPLIIRTFRDAIKSMSDKSGVKSNDRTSQDINIKVVIGAIVILTLLVWLIPAIPVSLLGAFIIVVFGFFFATVSSRMVGLVGSSNNPVSGMAIATLLISTLILKMTGQSGAAGMTAAIAIGSVICIVAAIAGDTSQDLKTGYILGSTPKKQQYGEIIGVVAAALSSCCSCSFYRSYSLPS